MEPNEIEQVVVEEPSDIEENPIEEQLEEPVDPPAPRVDPVQKRIDALVKKTRLQEEELEYWKSQSLKSQAQEPQVPVQKPVYEDFNDLILYNEALNEWNYHRIRHETQAQAEQNRVVQTHQARVKKFEVDHPDYNDVVAETRHMAVAHEINGAIAESEIGPEITYFLAKNPDEIERINKLPPARRLIEMGKLEAKLMKEDAPKKKVSAAPAPTSNVSGNKAGSGGMPNPTTDFAAWKKWRETQLKK